MPFGVSNCSGQSQRQLLLTASGRHEEWHRDYYWYHFYYSINHRTLCWERKKLSAIIFEKASKSWSIYFLHCVHHNCIYCRAHDSCKTVKTILFSNPKPFRYYRLSHPINFVTHSEPRKSVKNNISFFFCCEKQIQSIWRTQQTYYWDQR